MSKRGTHEGSIRRRGDSWQGRITLDGKPYTTTAGTRQEALRQIQTIAAKFYEGTLDTSPATVGEWLGTWQARGALTWKIRTRGTYENICRNHLVPTIGHIPLVELTHVDLTRVLHSTSRPAPTRAKMYRTIHRALQVAVYEGLIPGNPATRVQPPVARPRRPRLWTEGELRTFIREADWGAAAAPLWAILLGTGCRLGEALGLTWARFSGSSIQIEAALVEDGGDKVLSTPKTESSYREVVLPPRFAAILEKRRRGPTGFVVVTGTGNSPNRTLARRQFRAECDRVGVPQLRLHDLRHLHASVLIMEGVPITEVAHRLGHASPAVTTAIYSHVIHGQGNRSVEALRRAFGD